MFGFRPVFPFYTRRPDSQSESSSDQRAGKVEWGAETTININKKMVLEEGNKKGVHIQVLCFWWWVISIALLFFAHRKYDLNVLCIVLLWKERGEKHSDLSVACCSFCSAKTNQQKGNERCPIWKFSYVYGRLSVEPKVRCKGTVTAFAPIALVAWKYWFDSTFWGSFLCTQSTVEVALFQGRTFPLIAVIALGQCHAEGGATEGGVSKCEQTQTNADKRRQTQANVEAKTQANASKREQTWTNANKRLHPPLLRFSTPPFAIPYWGPFSTVLRRQPRLACREGKSLKNAASEGPWQQNSLKFANFWRARTTPILKTKKAPRIWAEILASNQFRESLRELLRE